MAAVAVRPRRGPSSEATEKVWWRSVVVCGTNDGFACLIIPSLVLGMIQSTWLRLKMRLFSIRYSGDKMDGVVNEGPIGRD